MTDGLRIARDTGRRGAEDAYKVWLQEDSPVIVVVDKKTIAFEFNEHYSDLDNLRQFLEISENAPDSDSKFGKKGRASTINPKFGQSSGKVRVFIRLISQNARDLLILGVRCFQAKKGLFTDKLLTAIEGLLHADEKWRDSAYQGLSTAELVLQTESYKKDISS
jgi:hypothetical protein